MKSNSSEYQIGEHVADVERKPRAGAMVSVRLSGDEIERIANIAEARGVTVTQLAREALQIYLTDSALEAENLMPPAVSQAIKALRGEVAELRSEVRTWAAQRG